MQSEIVRHAKLFLEVAAKMGPKRRESLLDYVPRVSPRFQRPEHLERLALLLEQAHREPLRVLVSVPPRHGKTELLLHSIGWLLREDPTTRVGYAGYNADIATSKSRFARDYALRAGVDLREDATALREWLTPQGGGLLAAGAGGTWTGHGLRVLMVDDSFKDRAEAESALIRDARWDWLTSSALTRLEPDGSAFIVNARWHEDDLIGRCLKERDKFIATNGAEGENWIHINLQAIDDITGAALWPELWPVHKLVRRRAIVGEYDWSSLFQGRPRPRDAKPFGRDPARYERLDLAGKRIGIAVDVAGTKKTRSNWTVAVVFAYWWELSEEFGDQLWLDVIEIHRWQEEIPEVSRRLQGIQKRWNVPLIVEASGLGKAVPQTLRDNNAALDITEVYPTTDKYLRSQAYSGAWKGGRVRAPYALENLTEFISVHKAFTGADDPVDDDVDAGAHAFNWAHDQGPFYDSDLGDSGDNNDFEQDLRFGDQRGFG